MEKWIICRKCGHEYSFRLSRCPNCNCITLNFKFFSSIILCFAILIVAIAGIVMGITDKDSNKTDITSKNSTVEVVSIASDVSNSNSATSSKTDSFNTDNSSDNKSVSAESNIQSTVSVADNSSQAKPNSGAKHKIGTEMSGDLYYITLPKYYLSGIYEIFGLADTGISFNEYAYKLDEDAKKTGFISTEQNSDGSATRCIGENKYRAYLTDLTAELLKMTIQMRRLDYIETVKHSDTFDTIDIKLKKEKLTDEEYSQIVIFGCFSAEKQLSTINSKNVCTVNLIYSDGKTESINFPEYLK